MLKLFATIIPVFFLTSCMHFDNTTDIEYQIKILEKKVKLLELDMQYIVNDACNMETDDGPN